MGRGDEQGSQSHLEMDPKGRAEVANAYLASIIDYRLLDRRPLPCLLLQRLLAGFLSKGRVPLVRLHLLSIAAELRVGRAVITEPQTCPGVAESPAFP